MEIIDRFFSKVEMVENGCWLWRPAIETNKYGKFWFNGKMVRVHRFAYETFVGPIAEGLFVCHHCDTPPCTNPEHLFSGTVHDNIADMVNKGRGRGLQPPLKWPLIGQYVETNT